MAATVSVAPESSASPELGRRGAPTTDARLFNPGPIEVRKQRVERLSRSALLMAPGALGTQLSGVPASLVARRGRARSWALRTEIPRHYMTAGGLWAPLVGTFEIVVVSLAFAAPVGVL